MRWAARRCAWVELILCVKAAEGMEKRAKPDKAAATLRGENTVIPPLCILLAIGITVIPVSISVCGKYTTLKKDFPLNVKFAC